MSALDLTFTVYLPLACGVVLGLSALLPGWRDHRRYTKQQRLELHLSRLGAVAVPFVYQLVVKRGDELGEGLLSVFAVTAVGVLVGIVVTGIVKAIRRVLGR